MEQNIEIRLISETYLLKQHSGIKSGASTDKQVLVLPIQKIVISNRTKRFKAS